MPTCIWTCSYPMALTFTPAAAIVAGVQPARIVGWAVMASSVGATMGRRRGTGGGSMHWRWWGIRRFPLTTHEAL